MKLKLMIFLPNRQIPQLNGSIWIFFMPFFYPRSSKNYKSKGQQAKKSYLVQVKKTEFFAYTDKKSCFFKLEHVAKFLAGSHLGPNHFGPWTFGPVHQGQFLTLDNLILAKISVWTISIWPKTFWPMNTRALRHFGPWTLGPMDIRAHGCQGPSTFGPKIISCHFLPCQRMNKQIRA